MTNDDILTTGKVARSIGMSVRTVCRLIDTGFLKGWRIPGSEHRRVSRDDLEEFMRLHGIRGTDENPLPRRTPKHT